MMHSCTLSPRAVNPSSPRCPASHDLASTQPSHHMCALTHAYAAHHATQELLGLLGLDDIPAHAIQPVPHTLLDSHFKPASTCVGVRPASVQGTTGAALSEEASGSAAAPATPDPSEGDSPKDSEKDSSEASEEQDSEPDRPGSPDLPLGPDLHVQILPRSSQSCCQLGSSEQLCSSPAGDLQVQGSSPRVCSPGDLTAISTVRSSHLMELSVMTLLQEMVGQEPVALVGGGGGWCWLGREHL